MENRVRRVSPPDRYGIYPLQEERRMSEDIERLIMFFMEEDHPHTIGQIAMSLEIEEEPLKRMLLRLQSMGYLHIAPLCPVIDIVVPGHKLTRMCLEEKNTLCMKLDEKEL